MKWLEIETGPHSEGPETDCLGHGMTRKALGKVIFMEHYRNKSLQTTAGLQTLYYRTRILNACKVENNE
jgi:hypothetical protein